MRAEKSRYFSFILVMNLDEYLDAGRFRGKKFVILNKIALRYIALI